MINDRGIWLDRDETGTHMIDEVLCSELIRILKAWSIKSVVDIGCGNGAYTKKLREAGFDCKGYDGSPLTPELSEGLCEIKDFSEPVDIGEFDCVLCLEVGEHLPEKYESIFLDNICKCSDILIMSWAIEGQPGTGHVNCRNNDYIIGKMRERGFFYWPETSRLLRDSSSLPWFKDTIIIFERCS